MIATVFGAFVVAHDPRLLQCLCSDRRYGNRHMMRDDYENCEKAIRLKQKEEEEAQEQALQDRHRSRPQTTLKLAFSGGAGGATRLSREEERLLKQPMVRVAANRPGLLPLPCHLCASALIGGCVGVLVGLLSQGAFIKEHFVDELIKTAKLEYDTFYNIDPSIGQLKDRGELDYYDWVPHVVDLKRGIIDRLPGRRLKAAIGGGDPQDPASTLAQLARAQGATLPKSLHVADRLYTRAQLLHVLVHLRHNTFLYWHHQPKPTGDKKTVSLESVLRMLSALVVANRRLSVCDN